MNISIFFSPSKLGCSVGIPFKPWVWVVHSIKIKSKEHYLYKELKITIQLCSLSHYLV